MTPEQQEILRLFAESCLERFLQIKEWNHDCPYDITRYAQSNPSSWLENCRNSTWQAIADGTETWERITEVAEKYRKHVNETTCP